MNVQSILGNKGRAVATVTGTATLADVAAQLRDLGIGAHIVGIVSERDVVRALAAHGAGALGRAVSSVMSTDVVTCVADDAVDSLMASMTDRRIRHLPVVDGDRLDGIISIGDIVKARLGELETERQALVDYIHGH